VVVHKINNSQLYTGDGEGDGVSDGKERKYKNKNGPLMVWNNSAVSVSSL